jgi:phosphoglycerate kinase
MTAVMIKSITSVKTGNKRVLVRAGFDVQLKEGGGLRGEGGVLEVVDDTRIRDILPTLKYLIDQGSRIIIVSHLGRPEGWDESKSMWPVAEKLAELLKYKATKVKDKLPDYDVPHVYFLQSDITKKKTYAALSKKIKPGEILFLENIRFYPGEKENDEKFVKTLGSFGDIYVEDAFSVVHRKEASTYGVAEILPHYAGISLLKEIDSLNRVMHAPSKPFILIMGGAKVVDKAETIRNLAKHANYILVGGALGNSFLAAAGYETGKSKVSDLQLAKQLLRNYKNKIILPVDVVVAKSEKDNPRSVDVTKIKPSDNMYDIGPKTVRKFAEYIKKGKTLVWNGPMGLIELRKFAFGSKALAQVFASKSKGPAYGVIGGGETIEVVDQAKVAEFIDHISTGGGAMLEFLAGKALPGIKILE